MLMAPSLPFHVVLHEVGMREGVSVQRWGPRKEGWWGLLQEGNKGTKCGMSLSVFTGRKLEESTAGKQGSRRHAKQCQTGRSMEGKAQVFDGGRQDFQKERYRPLFLSHHQA